MKRLLEKLRAWIFRSLSGDLEQILNIIIGRLESIEGCVKQQLAADREVRDAVVKDLVSEVNKLRNQLNERQAELPAGRRVARTFSEFRAAAEGRTQEKR